jgi:hypothetical protein
MCSPGAGTFSPANCALRGTFGGTLSPPPARETRAGRLRRPLSRHCSLLETTTTTTRCVCLRLCHCLCHCHCLRLCLCPCVSVSVSVPDYVSVSVSRRMVLSQTLASEASTTLCWARPRTRCVCVCVCVCVCRARTSLSHSLLHTKMTSARGAQEHPTGMTRDDQTDLRKNRTYPAAIRLCISPLTSRPLCNGAPSCVCVCGQTCCSRSRTLSSWSREGSTTSGRTPAVSSSILIAMCSPGSTRRTT